MAWIAAALPYLEAGGAALGGYSTLHQMKLAQDAQDRALAGPPPLTADQIALRNSLSAIANDKNFAQNFANQYEQTQQGAITQAEQDAANRAIAHLASLGRSTGGAYNAVNSDLAKRTADLLAQAHDRGLQLGLQQQQNAQAGLGAINARDFAEAANRQTNIANLANQTQANYGNLLGAGLGLGADYLANRPASTPSTNTFNLDGSVSLSDLLNARTPKVNYGKFNLSA